MSRIFEAILKTEGEAAEIAKSVLGTDSSASLERIPPQADSQSIPITMTEGATAPTSSVRAEVIPLPLGSPILPFHANDERAAEQYRIIRNKILHHPMRPQFLLVSSAMPGDGKTISALNLAGALALQENIRVLLVDCDFRRWSLSKLLGLNPVPGLGEVLRGEATLETVVVRIEQFPNLHVLLSGASTLSPSELLSTGRWQALQERLRREFGFVVFDSPPVGTVADYESLQLACDGVVLVVRPDHTNRQLWAKALETVPQVKQLGVILNCVEDWFLWKTHGYYYYSGHGR